MLVVDPSAILALVLKDEDGDYAKEVLAGIHRGGAIVPPIFWFEIRNVLIVNERRDRLTAELTHTFLGALAELPIEVATLPPDVGVLTLARTHRLTIYDAAYLDLASRLGLALATLDRQLRAAAQVIGVHWFDSVD